MIEQQFRWILLALGDEVGIVDNLCRLEWSRWGCGHRACDACDGFGKYKERWLWEAQAMWMDIHVQTLGWTST